MLLQLNGTHFGVYLPTVVHFIYDMWGHVYVVVSLRDGVYCM